MFALASAFQRIVGIGTEDAEAPPTGPSNTAFVFIKPHAVTEATKALVKAGLAAKGIKVGRALFVHRDLLHHNRSPANANHARDTIGLRTHWFQSGKYALQV
jgi:hypothetical protein